MLSYIFANAGLTVSGDTWPKLLPPAAADVCAPVVVHWVQGSSESITNPGVATSTFLSP